MRQENYISNRILARAGERIAAINAIYARSNNSRRRTNLKIKPSVIAGYVGVFAMVLCFVSLGYTKPSGSAVLANATTVNIDNKIEQTSVDEAIASSLAAIAANISDLPVATSVANLAVTNNVKSSMSQTGSSSFMSSKPQLIEATSDNRLIKNYVVVVGDTINSIAAANSISTQTIKWNNNMSTDKITIGQTLQILPIDGVIYTVKDTDTVGSIATKYKVDATKLAVYNDLDINSLKVGSKIILPDATLPENERPGYTAPVLINNYSNVGFGGKTWNIGYGDNSNHPYAWGNCTIYAYNRRKTLGLPVGSNWGNANTWDIYARRDGYVVDRTPSVGAIIQNGADAYSWAGHVAIVESILENGDLSISEMNAAVPGGGKNVISGRIVPAVNVAKYNYIH